MNPHRPLLAAILLTLGCGSLAAAAPLRLGGWAGVNLANVVFADDLGLPYDTWARPALGLELELPLGERWSLALLPGLVGDGARARTDAATTGMPGTVALELDSFRLPILLRRSFGARALRPYFAAGATTAYLRRARTVTEFDGEREIEDLTGEIRRLDAGFALGGGFVFVRSRTRYRLEALFEQGLVDLDASSDSPLRMQSIRLTFGVSFALGDRVR